MESDGEGHDDVESEAIDNRFRCRCSFAPRRRLPAGGGADASATNAYIADLLSESVGAPSKTMNDAAMCLAEACENLGQQNKAATLRDSDLSHLARDAAQTASSEAYTREHEASGDSSDDDEDDDEGTHGAGQNSRVAGAPSTVAVHVGGHSESSNQWRESKDVRAKVLGELTLEEFRRAPRHNLMIGRIMATKKMVFKKH